MRKQEQEVHESCKEWVTDLNNYCHEPADVIFWGKLFPPKALGPRCWGHGELHVSHSIGLTMALRTGWAIFDLRGLVRK